MEIREMRSLLSYTQSEFAARYNIPLRTVQNWEAGVRIPPEYVLTFLERQVKSDAVNRKTYVLPPYDSKKEDLPQRSDFIGAFAWLKAVYECVGGGAVFALDEALMCGGYFGGRSNEYIVWLYGDDSLSRFNGVVILGNKINPTNVREKNGIKYTGFNRTLADALANENILDMQGITEALGNYYYSHGNTFDGISLVPEYEAAFEKLAVEAINYYSA